MNHSDRPIQPFWRELQEQWGYPTIIGAHLELTQWADGLRDLAERLEETVEYLERDLKEVSRTEAPGDFAYSQEHVFLVATAAELLDRASGLAVARFST